MMLRVLSPSSSLGEVSRSFWGLFQDLDAALAKTQFLRQQQTIENMTRPRKRMSSRAINAEIVKHLEFLNYFKHKFF